MGYCGGRTENPTYHDLADHSETIQIDFDPERISYRDLLDVFWSTHYPCAASGSRQYASFVFVHDDGQRRAAEETMRAYEAEHGRVTTQIVPFRRFWIAEDYHQKYSLRNDRELMLEFREMYPRDADFVNSTAAARVNGFLSGEGRAADVTADLGLSEESLARLRRRVGE